MLTQTGFVKGLAAVSLFLVLVLSACGSSSGATPTVGVSPGAPTTSAVAAQPTPTRTTAPAPTPTLRVPTGTLVVAYAALGATGFDPITLVGTPTWSYGATIYDSTLWYQKDGTRVQGVVTRWEMAPDGMMWTYTLRDGMQFHNAEPVTAEDLKFGILREISPASTSSAAPRWRTALDNITVTDAKTMVLRLKQPWPSMPVTALVTVYPRSSFERSPDGKAFRENPVGSGPFKFKSLEQGIRIRVEATGQKHPFRPQPDFQTIEFLVVPEESTRVAMIKTGSADFIDISPDTAKTSGISVLQIPGQTQVLLRFWGLDNASAIKALPTGDARVREALLIAVNRQELVSTLLQGFGTLSARDHVMAGTDGFDPTWKALSYDPTRAKQLLAEAGFARGLKVPFYSTTLPGAPWSTSASEAIAGYWTAIGVQTEIINVEYATWRTMYRETPRQKILGSFGWTFGNKTFDVLGILGSSYQSNGAMHILAPDPQVDELLKRANTTLNEQERVQSIRAIVDIAFKSHVGLPIAETPLLYGASPKVAGWDPVLTGGPALSLETVQRK